MPPAAGARRVVGAMTGTSIDGIDVAIVRVEGAGLAMRAEVLRHHWDPLGDLADPLREAATGTARPAGDFATLARRLGACHADVIARVLGSEPVDLVAAHGQTIFHAPPVSWQLLDPHPIARRLGCRVVCDLRQADLLAGGDGAPITPLADWVLFGRGPHRRAIVNLGGFCNVTILPAADDAAPEEAIERVEGFDVCACNHVLDEIARRALGAPYDEDGAAARSGTARAPLAESLLKKLGAQRAEARSLGSGDELAGWVSRHVDVVPAADLAASAVEAITRCVTQTIAAAGDADEILVAGGGASNRALCAALAARTGRAVRLDVDDAPGALAAREAAAMAVLGALCADGVPITLPRVTGCAAPAPVAGRWCEPPAAPVSGPAAT